MKSVVIIAIAVGCSVVAVFGVLIGWNSYSVYQNEQESIEYQNQLAEQQRLEQATLEIEQGKFEQEVKQYRADRIALCNEIFGLSPTKRDSCLKDLEDDMWYVEDIVCDSCASEIQNLEA